MVAPVAVAAGGAAYNSANNEGGLLNQIIKLIVLILVIGIVIFLAVTVFLTITYWEEIGVFFTTGLIGWLNPFDSPDGDVGPTEIASDAVSGAVAAVPGVKTSRNVFAILSFPLRNFFNRF